MRFRWKPVRYLLAVLPLLALAGCGDGGWTPPAAIGNGADRQKDSAGDSSTRSDPRTEADARYPIVLIETSFGKIKVRLDAQKAPLTVDNFLSYVSCGHYDQTIFHEVLKEYPKVVIGGAYTAELTERPAQTAVRNEARNGLENRRGTIAMARQYDAVDSATCHFFFNVSDNQDVLDYKDGTPEGYGYCVFGEIVDGIDVLDKIAGVEVHDIDQYERIPVQTVLIKSIRWTR